MKSKLLLTVLAAFISSFGFSQISVSTGLAIPIGSFSNLDNGAAGLGYQISANWDKSMCRSYGISTGILLSGNAVNKESENFAGGQWHFSALELGVYIQPIENLRIKGLFAAGIYGTPEIEYLDEGALGTGGTISRSDFSPGFDLRIEYRCCKFFVGANLLYAKPNIDLGEYLNRPIEINSISNIGFMAGYIF